MGRLKQLRDDALLRHLDLPRVLPYLWRNPFHAESLVYILLSRARNHLARVPLEDAVLIQLEALLNADLPHLDIVILRTSEVCEGRAIALGVHCPDVDLK